MNAGAQAKPGRGAARGAVGGLACWLVPGAAAAVSGALMVWLAGLVRVPGSDGAEMKHGAGVNRRGDLPELIVTRLDWLPVGGEVRESLRLMDPTPLFMPDGRTIHSAAISTEIAERPGGEVTEPFAPALAFSDIGPARQILRPVSPHTPLDAATFAGGARWFAGLAREDDADRDAVGGPPALVATGRVDVYPRGGRERVASVAVPADATLDGANWQPVELDVLINAAGAVAAPIVTSGSGLGEVDERVRVLTTQEILPRLRLRPGAYRLVVGP